MLSAKALPCDLRQKTDTLLRVYTEEFGKLIDDRGFSRSAFSIFKPHNKFVGLDVSRIHFVFSFNNAVPGMSMVNQSDLREFGEVSGDQIVQICQRDLGYREYAYFNLPENLLSLTEGQARGELQKIAKQNLQKELEHIVRQTQALYVPTEWLRKYMAECSEDEFIEDILIPTLRQLGFERVRAKGHEERILEYGMDIRGLKYRLPTGHYLYFAGQVKRGRIHAASQKAKNVSTILAQLRMMYDSDIFDYDLNKRTTIDHALLICSGKITEQARHLLEKALEDEKRKFLLLDGQMILELCMKHGLPIEIQKKIERKYESKGT